MAEFMRNSDAFTWADGARAAASAPRWSRSSGSTGRRTGTSSSAASTGWPATLPMFRQRVVENPPPAPPRWEFDPDFDLTFHIHRMIAPPPGTFDYVLEMARQAEMADFDRARPLWEITLVEGLADGEAAHAVQAPPRPHRRRRGCRDRDDPLRPHPGRAPTAVRSRSCAAASRPRPLEGLRQSAKYDAGVAGALARTLVAPAARGPRSPPYADR